MINLEFLEQKEKEKEREKRKRERERKGERVRMRGRYRVCHGFRFRLQSKLLIFESILTSFKPSIVFEGSWGSTENWPEPKTEPQLGNLACPNL